MKPPEAERVRAEEGNVVEVLERHLSATARILGLNEKFFETLMAEPDDWSFVIKSHALLEAAVIKLLALHIENTKLDRHIEGLRMGARIELLKHLELASKTEFTMLRAFGDLRNRLVHRIKETDFTFEAYLADSDNRNEFGQNFSLDQESAWVRQYPRLGLWLCVVVIATKTLKEATKKAIEAERKAAIDALKRRLPAPDFKSS